MVHRQIRTAPADVERYSHGWHCTDWLERYDNIVAVLSLLFIQCTRLPFRRSASKPGTHLTMVRQVTGQGHGYSLPRYRGRRYACSTDRQGTECFVWLAWRL